MRVVLYRIVNRELAQPRWIEIPDGTRDFDAWLHANGYDGTYTIRRGIVTEPTAAETAAIQAEAARLKREGKLPSALGRIVGKLAEGR